MRFADIQDFPYDAYMNEQEITHFKKSLTDELGLLFRELKSVGRINPDDPSDWEATTDAPNTETAEMESRAAEITDFEDRSAVEFELEQRHNKIKAALSKIETGTYGSCEVCHNPIEKNRLNANPAALTCKAHMG